MILAAVWNWLDIALLLAITWCTFDVLRQTDVKSSPIHALALALICMGSFGLIMWRTTGVPIQLWRLSSDSGFAIIVVRYYIGYSRTFNRRERRQGNDRRRALSE